MLFRLSGYDFLDFLDDLSRGKLGFDYVVGDVEIVECLRGFFLAGVGEDYDGYVLSPAVFADLSEGFVAVHLGHLKIEEDDIW